MQPLERVLEPEVMDTPEEAQDYDSMDHAEVNARFVADFLARFENQLEGQEVLDLGTGTAQIPIELCRGNSGVKVVAVDLAANMLDLARANVEIANLTSRIRLERLDAKGLPYPDGRFAAVMSNSIIHHIPNPAEALAEAVRVTATGGALFFRDLMRPATFAELEKLVQTYAGNANTHQQKMFAESLHAALSLAEMRDLISQLGQSTDELLATSDRHWTWSAVKQ